MAKGYEIEYGGYAVDTKTGKRSFCLQHSHRSFSAKKGRLQK